MKPILIGVMAAVLAAAAQNSEAERQLKAAVNAELVNGDLQAAIKQYGAIAAKYKNDRAVTAMALVHMAECYQKMGDAESRKIYERVTREFGDQKEAVAMARARLRGSTTARDAGIVTRQVWTGPKVDTSGAVSPDGRLLSFTDWDTGDLALHDLTTGQDRRVTNKGTWNDSGEYAYGGAFSRDGKQVAYGWTLSAAQPLGKEFFFELRLIDLNGGKPRVLFANRDVGWITLHDWSSDGKWLAVGLERVDRTAQIALVSTVDGALRVLRSIDWRGASKMAFSPDGRYLAYDLPASEDSEQRDIYVMATDGSRETPAVAHPANDRVLGWSPDGNHLLFASDRSGSNGVWALAVSDGKPQDGPKLLKADINPGPMGLTRSGALYYFARGGGVDVYTASVDFETGKVLSPPAMIAQRYVGFNDSPKWSADGKYLAYISRPNMNIEHGAFLSIRSMETGTVRELRPNLANFYPRFFGALWSPDGSFLVVNGTDKKGRQGIYRIDQQSGEATLLVLRESGHDNPNAMGLSPDGKTLFITRKEVSSQKAVLLAHDMQSGKESEVVRRDEIWGVAVSRDGRLLAVTGFDRSTKSGSLLLVPAAGSESRELLRLSTSGPETLGVFVAWLPDGKSLLFRKGPSNARETFRIPVEGGAPAKYGAEWTVGPNTINPDGRQVAFQKGQTKFEVWVLENFLSTLTAGK